MLIGGKWVDASSGETYPIYNPYTWEVVDNVPKAAIKDARMAIESAYSVRDQIRLLDLDQRIGILHTSACLIEERKDEFIDVLVDNSGQPIKHAKWEVEQTSKTLEKASLGVKELHAEQIPSHYSDKLIFTIREPVGVLSTILPLNAPLALPSLALTAAIVAGNSVVLKAASETPLSALKFGEILLDAGLPKGVFNVITGSGKDLGSELIENPKVNMVAAFTSSKVGKIIASQAGKHLKKVWIDLPGSNPLIVLGDCNLKKAVNACVYGAYVNAGQICMAVEVVLVQENIAEDFTEKVVKETEKLKAGDPRDPKTDIGPLPHNSILKNVDFQIKDAVSKGAKILVGGAYEGLVYEPTVLCNVKPEMDIIHKRTAGPVAPIIEVKDIKEAVSISNNLKYGLRASVFTNSLRDALYAVHNLQVGGVMINENPFYVEEHFPWGGVKESGIGGVEYLVEMMTTKKLIAIHDIHLG